MQNESYNKLLKRNHLCICCKGQDAYTLGGRSLCYDCAEKQRLTKRIYTRNNAQKIKDRKKIARERLIQEHKCVRCGKPLPTDYGLKSCKICRAKSAAAWQRYIITRYGFEEWWRRANRGKHGLCWRCNKKPIEIGKMCKSCYDSAVRTGRKNLKAINNETHIWRSKNDQIKYT